MKVSKLIILLMTILLAVGIAGTAAAGGKQEESGSEETMQAEEAEESAASAEQESVEAEEIVIGISKFVQHPALDAVEQGIMDELAELGWDNISYDLQNANADANTSAQIATKFKSGSVDLAVGIATPTAQALVKSIKDIPVIYSAVTDPVSAGLVESYDKGEANVTGYSDMTPVRAQLELMLEIADVQTLGHVYTSGETNAVVLANKAREVCADLGIDFVEATVANSAEVRQAAQSIVGRVDAYYISTDNTVVSALNSLADVALKNNKLTISADPSSAQEFDILAALGFDYYKHGRATGRLIDRVLSGTPTADIPTQYMSDPKDVDQLLINLDVARQIGVEIPEEIKERANILIE